MSATDYGRLEQLAVRRARQWVKQSRQYPDNRAAKLLADVLKDPAGLDFTVSFVDGIIRPEDQRIAARTLQQLASRDIGFIPWYLRTPFKLGGAVAPFAPHLVMPLVKRTFAMLVGDLVVDVTDEKLGPAIARLKQGGARLNMNLLGEAVLGDDEADKRLSDTMQLLKRDDVDYVSLKVSAVTGPHQPWAYDDVVQRAVDSLLPLYHEAARYDPPKFINLDMEEYKDLHMTIDVFTRILSQPGLHELPAGIVLQTYLPDALPAMQQLQEWARGRVEAGGAPIKVRVVKGANLAMETVEADMHGWPLTTEASKQDTDTNYVTVLDWALTKERTKNIRIGVAGMNLFTVAFAYELAHERGVLENGGVEFEMLSGMAAPQARAVAEDTGHLLFYVPVVDPAHYDVAIAYLVRRLEENSSPQNFMSNIFDLSDEEVIAKEQERFRRAYQRMGELPVGPRRTQNRLTESDEQIAAPVRTASGEWTFDNTPDSDPALPANQEWARRITSRIATSSLGRETAAASRISDGERLDDLVTQTAKAGDAWAAKPARERAEILHRAGVELGKRRGDLMEIAAHECGKTLDQGDVEVSEAIDFCHYYAEQAKDIEAVEGATFVPSRVSVATPPWNFPIAIPCGTCVSLLASGSAVIFKPAAASARVGAVLAECLWAAGVPKEVLRYIQVGERELGQRLMTHPEVDRVVLTGGIDTAKLFRSWKPDMRLLAETSGKNSIIVTPSADLDLAVKDVVNSAFGHAGQKCSASSLAILVGSVGYSKRFHTQLVDAVKSLVIDYPTNPLAEIGPLTTPASGKLLRGLTTLGSGERWTIKPRQLDTTGRLWSPGVRAGVKPGSEYHMVEYFGPILGIMRCDTLEEAIEWQNATDYGLTAGLHSLDADEINYWLERVEAGNVYINRGITGAIVRRQPFGGWKRSAVGAGGKAGGPNYLAGLGEWQPAEPSRPNGEVVLRSRILLDARKVAERFTDASIREAALASLRSDQQALDREFGVTHDPSGLPCEKNVLRYFPLPVTIRVADDQVGEGDGLGEKALADLLHVVAAGRSVGSDLTVSVPRPLDGDMAQFLRLHHVEVRVDTDAQFAEHLNEWVNEAGLDGRIRLIGGSHAEVAQAVDGSVDVAIWSHPVTYSGYVEMLPFVHEQAVSFTNHRFGNRTPLSDTVEI
ncbi:bifunctional proline dehydrogenase/L-glutamate gamma-semialdehyde dehydrogenase [Nanchangia anserum]|uniref:L-glutamate gamma-semialdehyde dehydrogenase n=1 Tax=Nanchangia anserum TaxID=2692125 RepID=A0A8I0KQ75_9ACTO|nr:bifunctional proline dehydrogenase/L-glutamate gamma-semialdehyde dehydrogenase [Nanchangia anserum]MBD3689675.1 bifunctional proline dehydrogenase/L-glutamate gamma-semialdehyde dehydrogenase [Nanchangia anserum]QOX81852.1 bifunctional proline dehydrogenase/L-glutamate gamma-semialdehyde dehydrogenase [Nanchangia anserum]